MKRWIFGSLAALSLLLAVAIALLAGVGTWLTDGYLACAVTWNDPARARLAACTPARAGSWPWRPPSWSSRPRRTASRLTLEPPPLANVRLPETTFIRRRGFAAQHFVFFGNTSVGIVTLPAWLVALAFMILPSLWAGCGGRRKRHALRREQGLCPPCGYDLRPMPLPRVRLVHSGRFPSAQFRSCRAGQGWPGRSFPNLTRSAPGGPAISSSSTRTWGRCTPAPGDWIVTHGAARDRAAGCGYTGGVDAILGGKPAVVLGTGKELAPASSCHTERRDGLRPAVAEILRCAEDDGHVGCPPGTGSAVGARRAPYMTESEREAVAASGVARASRPWLAAIAAGFTGGTPVPRQRPPRVCRGSGRSEEPRPVGAQVLRCAQDDRACRVPSGTGIVVGARRAPYVMEDDGAAANGVRRAAGPGCG